MGVLKRQLQRFATLADEASAAGGVAVYILRPNTPGWAYAYITTMTHGAACLCCKTKPCGETTTIISLQAAADATLMLPMPICADCCCNPKQILASIDCVCMDLFPRPVQVQLYGYRGDEP